MTFVQLVLVAGATCRLVRLVQTDSILDRPRARVVRALGDRKITELLWCPWCLSTWGGGLVAGSWWAWGDGRGWAASAGALTASHVTGLLSTWEDR